MVVITYKAGHGFFFFLAFIGLWPYLFDFMLLGQKWLGDLVGSIGRFETCESDDVTAGPWKFNQICSSLVIKILHRYLQPTWTTFGPFLHHIKQSIYS